MLIFGFSHDRRSSTSARPFGSCLHREVPAAPILVFWRPLIALVVIPVPLRYSREKFLSVLKKAKLR